MGVSVGSLDLPDQPDEPGRAEPGDASRLTPKPRELPDPDERGQYYEAMQGHVSAETAEEASPGSPPDGTDQGSYWDEVPRLMEVRAGLDERWPDERRAAADRSADPSGSYRSDGGFYLSPERYAETIAAFSRIREAEPGISAHVRTAEQENRYGGWLEGFRFRLKGEDRFKEKVAEALATIGPDATPEELLAQVPDGIRYNILPAI
jgi:hypothetical protein